MLDPAGKTCGDREASLIERELTLQETSESLGANESIVETKELETALEGSSDCDLMIEGMVFPVLCSAMRTPLM